MAKSSAKRKKQHTPKLARIPVTQSLADEFARVLYSALAAAEVGQFSKRLYDNVGQSINCIWRAMNIRELPDKSARAVIEGAMRAMNDCGARDEAGGWQLRQTEQMALRAAVIVIERNIGYMSVTDLYAGMDRKFSD